MIELQSGWSRASIAIASDLASVQRAAMRLWPRCNLVNPAGGISVLAGDRPGRDYQSLRSVSWCLRGGPE
jgi:hypothetical protein